MTLHSMPKRAIIRDPNKAFGNAIDKGLMSIKPWRLDHYGKYFYMYSFESERKDIFKHKDTRAYITVTY